MNLYRCMGVSFALAMLFGLPTMVSLLFHWNFGFMFFGGLLLFFGSIEISCLALMELLDK